MLLLYSLQVELNSFIKTLKMTSAQVVEISFQQQQFFSEIPLPRWSQYMNCLFIAMYEQQLNSYCT